MLAQTAFGSHTSNTKKELFISVKDDAGDMVKFDPERGSISSTNIAEGGGAMRMMNPTSADGDRGDTRWLFL